MKKISKQLLKISKIIKSNYDQYDFALECSNQLLSKKHNSENVQKILKQYKINENNVDYLRDQLSNNSTDQKYLNFLFNEISIYEK